MLVQCLRGTIWDVVVDIRPTSPNFRKWEANVLDDLKLYQRFIPPGFAHGFCVMSEVADVYFRTSHYFDPEQERCIRWNDPDIAVAWPNDPVLISDRDADAPLLRDLEMELRGTSET